MNCPKCPGILQELTVPGTELTVDRCPMCGGLWFDKDELPGLFSARFPSPPDLEMHEPVDEGLLAELDMDGRQVRCPRCADNRPLTKMPSPRGRGMLIDYCENCSGIWLDRGEYAKMSRRSPAERFMARVLAFLDGVFTRRR